MPSLRVASRQGTLISLEFRMIASSSKNPLKRSFGGLAPRDHRIIVLKESQIDIPGQFLFPSSALTQRSVARIASV